MRMYSSLVVLVFLGLVGCGVQTDQGAESQSRESDEDVESSSPANLLTFGCTATTTCTGVTKSCSGQSCSAFADRVVCDGYTTYCSAPPNYYCLSNADCSSPNSCGPDGGLCKNKTCLCY